MPSEVVFFFGPPFSGKTLHYVQHYSQTHQRICPHKLFEADPTLSLRAVILKVISFINKGQSVVVDDGNSCKKTRNSYLTLLKNKAPHCQYRVVHFQVTEASGPLQCLWCREWQLAQQMELSTLPSFLHSAQKLEQWFEKKAEPPSEEEGFKDVNVVNSLLVCDTPYKFEIPALLLQWEGVFQNTEDKAHGENVADVVRRWSNSNSSGRVIIVKASEKHSCKEATCGCIEEMKNFTRGLVTHLSIPIYFVHLTSFMWSFSKPPQPGMLAWFQRLHCIDLSHRATFYVFSSETHSKAASAAGVKCIKASKLFGNPQMINAVYCGVVSQAPECVRKARLAWFGYSDACDEKDPQQSRPGACVPLFQQTLMSRDPLDCVTVVKAGRVHGMCYKDFASLERYNSLYKSVATPTELASYSTVDYKPSSSILTKQEDSKAVKAAAVEIPDVEEESAPCGALSPSSWVKQLLAVDIQKHAFSSGHFTRGKGCTKLIRNVKHVLEQDGVLLSAKCLGSQGQLYDVSALVGLSGIVEAGCSCPDPASKLGKCKHVIGLLLRCKEEENIHSLQGSQENKATSSGLTSTRTRTPKKVKVCTISSDSKQGQPGLQLAKSKSLPQWMSSLAQNTQPDSESGRRIKNQSPATRTNQKRLKRKQSAKITLYCMSPEELFEAAKQVMEEHRCSLSDSCSDEQIVALKKKHLEDKRQVESSNNPQHYQEECKRRKQLDPSTHCSVLDDVVSVGECSDEIPPSVDSRYHSTKAVCVVPETAGMIETSPESFDAQPNNSTTTPSSEATDNQSRHLSTTQKADDEYEQGRRQNNQDEEKQETKLKVSILDDFI